MASKLLAHHCAAWLTAAVVVCAVELAAIREDPQETGQCVTAVITRVIDGDTYVGQVDLPLGVSLREEHIRLYGVDTPELSSHDELQQQLAEAARRWAEQHVQWQRVTLEVHGRDSFGRVLARVFLNGNDVGKMLLEKGLAKEWTP